MQYNVKNSTFYGIINAHISLIFSAEVPLLPRIGVDPNYFAKIEGIHIDG